MSESKKIINNHIVDVSFLAPDKKENAEPGTLCRLCDNYARWKVTVIGYTAYFCNKCFKVGFK